MVLIRLSSAPAHAFVRSRRPTPAETSNAPAAKHAVSPAFKYENPASDVPDRACKSPV
jgi:hypothetical protein